MPGAHAAVAALARRPPARGPAGTALERHAPVLQSVLTGNLRPLAELKLGAAGFGPALDLEAGAYGDAHEVRAELVGIARRAAAARYGTSFDGPATVLVGDTPLDVAAALATGARAVAVATGGFCFADLAAAGAHVTLPDLTDTDQVVGAIAGG